MIISIAWRNVWRNKLRSTVIISATALGICAGIFSAAFYSGMADQRIEKAIKSELSHIQIHQPDFLNSNEIHDYIPNANAITGEIEKMPGVAAAGSRIVIHSMISSAETAAGVKITGVTPEKESHVTNISVKIEEGSYFGDDKRNQVIIGHKLADKLAVKLNSKVVLTLLDMDNNMTYGAFRVTGIYNTLNNMFDEVNIFVRYDDLSSLINLPAGAAHEIAILSATNEGVENLAGQVKTLNPELEVLSWLELSPEMEYLTSAMDITMYIFIIIILLALLFGIINTMLMVVLERVKELGMLMAVGMNKTRIFMMILMESIFLTITGGIVGVGAGVLISKHFETNAIDLSAWGEAYTDLGYDPFVYTVLDWNLIVNVVVLVLITGIIAALYPAYKALQQDPSEALRTE